MPFFDAIRIGASGAVDDFTVDRSLRLNSRDSAYLQNTPSSGGNRKKNTLSMWVKLGITGISDNGTVASCNSSNSDSNNISVVIRTGSVRIVGYYNNFRITNRILRDPSAWYHIVVAIDTAQSSADNRIKLYVNGIQETSFSTSGNVSQNDDLGFAQASTTRIGARSNDGVGSYFDGYIAEVNFIDGQALTPSSFAETDAVTGQWNPIDTSGLTFGTTGFYLKFADNSGTTATTLGKDSSGNGNNFTPNNLSVYDSMPDTPTNNFATMNPLNGYTSLSQGNLRFNAYNDSGGQRSVQSSIALPKSGKWYWEARYQEDYLASKYFGLSQIQMVTGYLTAPTVYYDSAYGTIAATGESNVSGGSWYNIGSGSSVIVSIAVDVDNNSVKYYKNNSLQGTIALPTLTSLQEYFFTWANSSGGSNSSLNDTFNFGADSTFQGQETSGGNTDANGIGDFKYAPPSGHLALCSANLPNPTIVSPTEHFNTLLYTGDGSSTRTLTGVGFQPDWTWKKERNQSYSIGHMLYDSVRGLGVDKHLDSSTKLEEGSGNDAEYGYFTGFTSDGFSVSAGSSGDDYVNDGSNNYVTWNWNAGNTDGKTYAVTVVSDSGNKYRFDGFGTSAVTLDLAEGGTYIFDQSDSSNAGHPLRFSTTSNGTHGGGTEYTTGVTTAGTPGSSGAYTQIVVAASAPTLYYYCTNHSGMGGQANTNSTLGSSNFDGTLQTTVKVNALAGFSIVKWQIPSTAVYTIGHGLGVAPKAIFMKSRDGDTNWDVFHQSIGNTKRIRLNTDDDPDDFTGVWNDTDPTSTVFTSTGSWLGANKNIIAYVFSEVAGFSKFGSYTGNGSNDGTFVFTGFKVSFLICKKTSGSGNWGINDAERDFNSTYGNDASIYANTSGAETTSSSLNVDFLSNGFKLRSDNSSYNGNGGTYIYFAWAELPFKNARAR